MLKMSDDVPFMDSIPLARLKSIEFGILTDTEIEKVAVLSITEKNQVCDSKLGLPNTTNACSTCCATETKYCDGHPGAIELPTTNFHPHMVGELVNLLNKVCPACKKDRQTKKTKSAESVSRENFCKYCDDKSPYPKVKFKLLRKDGVIVMETKSNTLPDDFWEFLPEDEISGCPESSEMKRLTPTQANSMLNDLDPDLISKYQHKSFFLNFVPVTPNGQRVVENNLIDGNTSVYLDERTTSYRKLVFDCSKVRVEDATRSVFQCLNMSKLSAKSTAGNKATDGFTRGQKGPGAITGRRWMKDIVIGKRSDFSFRATLVGDSKIHLDEIGIPTDLSDNLRVPLHVCSKNLSDLQSHVGSLLNKKEDVFVRRKDKMVSVDNTGDLNVGDIVYRSLNDGDVILINRPPSVHLHSLIALRVKVLPVRSVVKINPLCCAPLFGDFDGDCLHGYIPQSLVTRVELEELVGLQQQLLNEQNDQLLIGLGQDSLSAVHMVMDCGIYFNKFQIQQLSMFCPGNVPEPAIVKSPLAEGPLWTGEQFFSMFLPSDITCGEAGEDLYVSKGEIITSSLGSHGIIWANLLTHDPNAVLDSISSAQEALCECISSIGFSVSLLDLYICSDLLSRSNLLEEANYGIRDAVRKHHVTQLMTNFLADHGCDGAETNNSVVDEFDDSQCNFCRPNKGFHDVLRKVYSDIGKVTLEYTSKENSIVTMIRAGSKGSLQKLVQQGVCLGLQLPRQFLSFRIPCNIHSSSETPIMRQSIREDSKYVEKYMPSAIVKNSFLHGLNPSESFIHSVSVRGNTFGDNADIPGTLTRKLGNYLRALYVAYDGTIRSSYGEQIYQFSYDVVDKAKECKLDRESQEMDSAGLTRNQNIDRGSILAGRPVGARAASSISQILYGALDEPVSYSSSSPLLEFKKLLDGGVKQKTDLTARLFLSDELRHVKCGLEYAALEVRKHLERVTLLDVVTDVMVIYNKDVDLIFAGQGDKLQRWSPWVCHIQLSKDKLSKKSLTVGYIAKVLAENHKKKAFHVAVRKRYMLRCSNLKSKTEGPDDLGRKCSIVEASSLESDAYITVAISDIEETVSPHSTMKELAIPSLLQTAIIGEFDIVEILWMDHHKGSRFHNGALGDLYLDVVLKCCAPGKFWNSLQKCCVAIYDLIDWRRSHPISVPSVYLAFGICGARNHFLDRMKSLVAGTGDKIHERHLSLIADCLSVTGEFSGLSERGMKQQRAQMSISSPFAEAFVSKPYQSLLKAAKEGISDELLGASESIAWGKEAPVGTRSHFEILYSEKVDVVEPLDVCTLLCESEGKLRKSSRRTKKSNPEEYNPMHPEYLSSILEREFCLSLKTLISKKVNCLKLSNELKIYLSLISEIKNADIDSVLMEKMEDEAKVVLEYMRTEIGSILRNNTMGAFLNKETKKILLKLLAYHPRKDEKLGTGVKDIKIGQSKEHPESRCFIILRKDGTEEDFSYRKCIVGYADLIECSHMIQ